MQNHPDVYLIVLLIDKRRRSNRYGKIGRGELLALPLMKNPTAIAMYEIVLEKAKSQ